MAVTKDDFGDSLNRPIGVGRHPLGFGGDHFDGLVYEPRVTLGALAPFDLLWVPELVEDPQLLAPGSATESSMGGAVQLIIPVQNLPGTTQELVLTEPEIDGPDFDNFVVSSFDTPIEPDGGTGNITVDFTPDAGDGIYEATLTINSNDASKPDFEVALSVNVRDPAIVIDPSLDFGSLPAQPDPVVGNLGVANEGEVTTLTLSNPEITGPGADAFSITSLPESIPPGGEASIGITFAPTGGCLFIAQLSIETNDPRNEAVVIDLSGSAAGSIDLDGQSMDLFTLEARSD